MAETNDFKTHFIMVMVFLVILIISTGTAGFACYKVGRANGKLQGTLELVRATPPVVMNGPGCQNITNNNVAAKPSVKVKIWPPCLGVCP